MCDLNVNVTQKIGTIALEGFCQSNDFDKIIIFDDNDHILLLLIRWYDYNI